MSGFAIYLVIIRPHRSICPCVCVCLLVTFVTPAKRLNRSRCRLGADSCGLKENVLHGAWSRSGESIRPREG